MKWPKRIGVVHLVGVAGFGLLLVLGSERRGVGFFDQPIILDTNKTVRRVLFRDCGAEEAQSWVSAKPHEQDLSYDLKEAERSGDQFLAGIMFTTRESSWTTKFYNRSHLVISVEFTDGTRAYHAAPIPPGRGREAVTVPAR